MRKWIAILKDGSCVVENIEKSNWIEIKDKVAKLELDIDGQIISLPENMSEYMQGKTASGDLFTGKCKLESRYIGFVNNGVKTVIRVNEASNKITIEIS